MKHADIDHNEKEGSKAKQPNRVRMTQLWLRGLRPPRKGRVIYWDTDLPGFGLRVSARRPGDTHLRGTWIVAFRQREQNDE
jgi:hypothetical protein